MLDFNNNIGLYVLAYILPLFMIISSVGRNNSDILLGMESSNALKGLGMFCIIIHHITLEVAQPGYAVYFRNLGFWGSGLFLFCSGYGCYKSMQNNKDYLKSFVKGRIAKVYMHAVLANIFFYLIYSFSQLKLSARSVLKAFFMINCRTGTIVWFFICILIFYIMFYLIYSLTPDNNISLFLLFFCALCYMMVVYFLHLGSFWINISFTFPFGVLLAKYEKEWIKKVEQIHTLLYSLVCVILFFFLLLSFKISWEQALGRVVSDLICMNMLLLIIVVWFPKIRLKCNPLLYFLNKNSLELYFGHMTVVLLLYKLVPQKNSWFLWLYLIIVLIVSKILFYLIELFDKLIFKRK